MRQFIEINGKRYEWCINHDVAIWSCLLCAGYINHSVCAASCCMDMPAHRYLKLAQPKSAQNTPSEARRKAGGK